jgi:hypothetical protein
MICTPSIKMDGIKDEDRKRRLRQLEETIQDPRSIANVDCLLVSCCYCYDEGVE